MTIALQEELKRLKIELKKAQTETETKKILINGTFGKLGSPYSILYAPEMLIQTTVTGQLLLLMLIEQFTLAGFEVLSANTDGVVTRVPKDRRGFFKSIVVDWEWASGMEAEYTYYRSIHSRDVNNYTAFKKGKGDSIEVKRKGVFAHSGRGIPAAMGLKKTPNLEIAYDAAVAYLLDGTPVESTVRNCQDIRKFVTVRAVKGGAEKDGEPIAKVVRYYYSAHASGPLVYASSGNRVPRSDGAQPCMTLPDELPGDIDYAFYEREAYAILDECGLAVIDPTTVGRKGKFLGKREDQKTIHTINAATGVAVCGVARPSRRDLWIEYTSVPEGERYCSKCRKLETL
jgi:hypothetical protein